MNSEIDIKLDSKKSKVFCSGGCRNRANHLVVPKTLTYRRITIEHF